MSTENLDLDALRRLILTGSQEVGFGAQKRMVIPTRLVPEDMKVQSLEQYLEAPVRFRGRLTSSIIPDWVNYCIVQPQCMVFVSPEDMTANAFFDLGIAESPGFGQHTARLELKRTTPFREILGVSGHSMGQKDMADWLIDWAPHLSAIDGDGVEMSMSGVIDAIRNVTVDQNRSTDHGEGDMQRSRTAMEKIAMSSKRGQLPAAFLFNCEPYRGLAERTFKLRLSMSGGDEPALRLRIVALEKAEEDMTYEFQKILQEAFSQEDVTVYLGDFANANAK